LPLSDPGYRAVVMEVLTRDITAESYKPPQSTKGKALTVTQDGTNWLPDDILMEIMKLLSRYGVAHAGRVCRDWHRVASSEHLAWIVVQLTKFDPITVSPVLPFLELTACSPVGAMDTKILILLLNFKKFTVQNGMPMPSIVEMDVMKKEPMRYVFNLS
jgi:hypothetical protein